MSARILVGDALVRLNDLEDESINTIVTSPPYFGQRNYNNPGQIGLESNPLEYIDRLVTIFRECRRVCRRDATCWIVIGDSYNAAGRWGRGTIAGFKQNTVRVVQHGDFNNRASWDQLKSKDLMLLPHRLAIALQDDGWYVRQDIVWHKPNPMTEPVKDRCTKAHEYIFLLSRSERYYFDSTAIAEPAKTGGFRNKRSVWTVAPKHFPGTHFAAFPPALIEPCIRAGCPSGGIVLDPFGGSGTTSIVAQHLGRNSILIEINPEYADMAAQRCQQNGIDVEFDDMARAA